VPVVWVVCVCGRRVEKANHFPGQSRNRLWGYIDRGKYLCNRMAKQRVKGSPYTPGNMYYCMFYFFLFELILADSSTHKA
jgi:hypothetical protein